MLPVLVPATMLPTIHAATPEANDLGDKAQEEEEEDKTEEAAKEATNAPMVTAIAILVEQVGR